MACGDALLGSLAVAAGMTVDEPCSTYESLCSSDDVDEWNTQAWAVASMVEASFAEILFAEADNAMGSSLSDTIRGTLLAYDLAMADIEAPGAAQYNFSYAFGGLGNSIEAIREAQAAIAIGACAMERINVVLTSMASMGIAGIGPIPIIAPPMPKPAEGIPWYAWAALGVLLLGGVYVAGRVA